MASSSRAEPLNTSAASGVSYEALKLQALALPEVEESTSYGTPSLKLRKTMMVRLKEDRETVVLRTTWEERERLLVVYPEVFFITEHYRNYSYVLMRLAAATPGLVSAALELAWCESATPALLKKHRA